MDISLSQEVAVTVVTLLQNHSRSIFETIKQNNPLAFFATILCIPLTMALYLRFFHPLASFPGPPLAPSSNGFWYYTLLAGRGPWKNHSWHQKWGAIIRIAPNHLSFSSHAAQKSSTASEPAPYHQWPKTLSSSRPSTTNLLENEDVLVRRTDEFMRDVGKIDSNGGRGFNIVKQFNYVTFNIMGEMSFGDSFEARLQEQKEHRCHWADVIVNTTFMNDVMHAVCVIPGLFTLLEYFKTPHMKATLYRHAEYATEHTEARLRTPSARKDFMDHIQTTKLPLPSTLEIASHFNVIMMAGAVTTATFLAGVTHYLSRSPSCTSRLQHELRSRFASLEGMTSKALMQCEYLNAVVEEGPRIFPPAGAGHLSRIVPAGGVEIAGAWIPGGTRVSVHQWSVLRDSANFHEPASFIPERWFKDSPFRDRLETSLPFSYGPRGCLGRNLAYLEMRMVLAKLFWAYNVVWFDKELDWERDCKGYTLWEKPDLRVVLRKVMGHV